MNVLIALLLFLALLAFVISAFPKNRWAARANWASIGLALWVLAELIVWLNGHHLILS